MKHMKKIIMVVALIALAAGALYMVKCHFMNKDSEVKIQGFCLGLCGQNADGTSGGGIGIGASDRGPLIGVGPWGNKSKHTDNNNDDYSDEDSYNEDDDSYDEEA